MPLYTRDQQCSTIFDIAITEHLVDQDLQQCGFNALGVGHHKTDEKRALDDTLIFCVKSMLLPFLETLRLPVASLRKNMHHAFKNVSCLTLFYSHSSNTSVQKQT